MFFNSEIVVLSAIKFNSSSVKLGHTILYESRYFWIAFLNFYFLVSSFLCSLNTWIDNKHFGFLITQLKFGFIGSHYSKYKNFYYQKPITPHPTIPSTPNIFGWFWHCHKSATNLIQMSLNLILIQLLGILSSVKNI
mgnify:CR=1 FL=1